MLKSEHALLQQCLLKDVHQLSRQLHKLRKFIHHSTDTSQQDQLRARLEASVAKVEVRRAAWPKLNYPDLPVSEHREKILTALKENQVLVIAGETGSGKTTQLPKICLELGLGARGLIGHTQPRRLAARSVAQRLAEELAVPLGEQVGYQVRFHDQQSDNTLIKLMSLAIILPSLACRNAS